jgi:hypothetical protein
VTSSALMDRCCSPLALTVAVLLLFSIGENSVDCCCSPLALTPSLPGPPVAGQRRLLVDAAASKALHGRLLSMWADLRRSQSPLKPRRLKFLGRGNKWPVAVPPLACGCAASGESTDFDTATSARDVRRGECSDVGAAGVCCEDAAVPCPAWAGAAGLMRRPGA